MEPVRRQINRADRGGCIMAMSLGDFEGEESNRASVLVIIDPAAAVSLVTARSEQSRATSIPSTTIATVTLTCGYKAIN